MNIIFELTLADRYFPVVNAIVKNIQVMEVNVLVTHKQCRINVCMEFGYVSDKTIEKDAPDTRFVY